MIYTYVCLSLSLYTYTYIYIYNSSIYINILTLKRLLWIDLLHPAELLPELRLPAVLGAEGPGGPNR